MAYDAIDESTAADDLTFARELAARTGEILLKVRDDVGFANGRDLQNAGDRAAEDFIDAQLRRYRPDDAILSEEAPDNYEARRDAERVWIIDPVDGTSAFAKRGSTEFAVHVALWERGEVSLGVVSRPATGEIYDSRTARIAAPEHSGKLRIIASRSRASDLVRKVCADLDADVISMSSAGIKMLAVLNGEADAYLHTGGQYQWDNAAPVAVALGAGLVATRFDGRVIEYNAAELAIDDLLICRPEYAEEFRSAIDARLAG